MYHPGKTQPDVHLATLQRTFYPKHCHYFGSGSGRDSFIIMNNGGFNTFYHEPIKYAKPGTIK